MGSASEAAGVVVVAWHSETGGLQWARAESAVPPLWGGQAQQHRLNSMGRLDGTMHNIPGTRDHINKIKSLDEIEKFLHTKIWPNQHKMLQKM